MRAAMHNAECRMMNAESRPADSSFIIHHSSFLPSIFLAGTAVTLIGIYISPARAWAGLLLAAFYILGLCLAAMVILALHHVTKAGWSAAIRRVPEAMLSFLPVVAVLMLLVLLLGRRALYPASSGEEIDASVLAWRRPAFFYLRALVCLATWLLFAWAMLRLSRRQDQSAQLSISRKSVGLSAAFLVAFAITFSLASFEWIMPLERNWYSTIFAVYNFSGALLAALAAVTLSVILLRKSGAFGNALTDAHIHDLGKYVFAFSTFWAYIWFSQYMLIWYANTAEETPYFVRRQSGAWWGVCMLAVALNWAIPFFALLSANTKRNSVIVLRVCIVVLVGHWVDLYTMIEPPLRGASAAVGLWEIAPSVALAALFIFVFLGRLKKRPLLPANDPYLVESLHHRPCIPG